MNRPIYNCIIDESPNDNTGIYAISFVDLPANEVDFVALSRNRTMFLNKDAQKQILTGVVLKPEQLIYRFSEKLGDYYVRFSSDQIEKIAQKMMKTGVALHNTTHQHLSPLSGNYLTELWIVEDPQNDKSKALGFENLPKGTLMCSYKIENIAYWQTEVMTGNVKGFSLEGFFQQELNMSKLDKQINKKDESMKKKKFVFSKMERTILAAVLSKEKLSEIESIEDDAATGKDADVEFILKDGKTVMIDAKTTAATIDGKPCPPGDHALADGGILVIDEDSNFVETKETPTAATDPKDAKATETLRKAKANLAKAKRQRMDETESEGTTGTDTIEALKSKIAEMEDLLAELTQTVDNAQAEVQELRKKSPSASPARPKVQQRDFSKMTNAERMAHVLSLSCQNRSK